MCLNDNATSHNLAGFFHQSYMLRLQIRLQLLEGRLIHTMPPCSTHSKALAAG